MYIQYIECSCFVFLCFKDLSFHILTIVKHRKREISKTPGFHYRPRMIFISLSITSYCIIIRSVLSAEIYFKWMKLLCLILCYMQYIFYCTHYQQGLLSPPLGNWLLIDGEESVPASTWQRGGWSYCCYVCTQAQGPANCVSFPSNKRSFERRWCVLLCVTVLPGESIFLLCLVVRPLFLLFEYFFLLLLSGYLEC